MSAYFLGVDGGQSGMRALVADEECRVVGRGLVSGAISPTEGAGSRRPFADALRSTISAALARAGLAPDTELRAACLGFSGGPDDKEALAREIVRAQNFLITHDAWIALAGATGGGPGIVVIAGTGSIAFGRSSKGVTARAGGWGFAFGDEGSAFDIARQAIRAALRHEEGWGPPTALRAGMIEATGARNVNELIHRYYSREISRAQIARFAELVESSAKQGDIAAQELLGSAAQSLALLAGAVRRQLFEEYETAGIHYAGGVFRSDPILQRFRFLVEMDERTPVSPPRFTPVEGALLEAFRIAGVDTNLKNT